jgi:hypothetical protein
MKAFTDIEQSKKLAEILPPESVDMYYHNRVDIPDNYPLPIEWKRNSPLLSQEIPCWSLAALLEVIPRNLKIVLAINDYYKDIREDKKYAIGSVVHNNYDCYADNPIDACYEMILKLHEQKLL